MTVTCHHTGKYDPKALTLPRSIGLPDFSASWADPRETCDGKRDGSTLTPIEQAVFTTSGYTSPASISTL